MWINEKISENNTENIFTVNVAGTDGDRIGLAEGNDSAKAFYPYGVFCIPPDNERAVIAKAGRTLCIIGCESKCDIPLKKGEIALYSSGGASIVLKNDGRVIINGHEFSSSDNP